jgi:hypothetical protein
MANEDDTRPLLSDAYRKEFNELIPELALGNDRAACLVAAAKIDNLVREILVKALRPNPNRDDELFDGDRPLSTLSAKIALAFRLGLIDAAFARTLHLIRKLRNDFAHEVVAGNLDSGANRHRVQELVSPLAGDPLFEDLKKATDENEKTASTAAFIAAVVYLIARLLVLRDVAEPLKVETEALRIPGLQKKNKGATPVSAPTDIRPTQSETAGE